MLTPQNLPRYDQVNETFIYYVNKMFSQLPAVQFIVTSSWRSESENKAVGGVEGSKHLTGNAIDISITGVSPDQIFYAAQGLPLDVIHYPKERYYHIELDWKNQFFTMLPGGTLQQKFIVFAAMGLFLYLMFR